MEGLGVPLHEIREGYRTSHRYVISDSVYERFLEIFHDTNALHTEDDFARRLGFPEKVMHGSILNGFISHFVGVHFPGGRVLLHSVDTRFKTPCHLGDEIEIEAVVSQVVSSVRVVTMALQLTNETRSRIAAKAKVQVGLLE